jgi:low temperature requirement protein LtrA
LAAGAILFTVLLYADIWAFGTMMRDKFIPKLAFKPVGQAILFLMAALLIAAWSLAVSRDFRYCVFTFAAGVAGLQLARTWVNREAKRGE